MITSGMTGNSGKCLHMFNTFLSVLLLQFMDFTQGIVPPTSGKFHMYGLTTWIFSRLNVTLSTPIAVFKDLVSSWKYSLDISSMQLERENIPLKKDLNLNVNNDIL